MLFSFSPCPYHSVAVISSTNVKISSTPKTFDKYDLLLVSKLKDTILLSQIWMKL